MGAFAWHSRLGGQPLFVLGCSLGVTSSDMHVAGAQFTREFHVAWDAVDPELQLVLQTSSLLRGARRREPPAPTGLDHREDARKLPRGATVNK